MSFPNLYIATGSTVTVSPQVYFVDGENLTYSFSISDPSVAEVAASGTDFIFKGLKAGVTEAEISLSSGKTETFTITVRDSAGNGWL